MDFLVYLSLTLVVLYTARLARSKARNPWLWAGAAFVLVLIPDLKLLGMAPMIALWFLKSPQAEGRTIRRPDACPKCYAPQPQRSRFCTNCGSQLRATDANGSAVRDEAPLSTTVVEAPEPMAGPEPMPDSEAATAAVDPGSPPAAGHAPAEGKAPPPTEQPGREAKQPVSPGVPTSAGMTERGVRLFNQGRIQESIDQFTKAIALDSNYTQAWARRAEAYARLGRGKEAAEDRRRLEALNAGSPSG